MSSSHIRFCEECGAGNTSPAVICFACHAPLELSPSLSESLIAPASTASSGGQIQIQEQVSATASHPGNLIMGRYQIVREIGQGGFGVVYLARDLQQAKRRVAIKQITLAQLSARDMIDATDSYNREVTLLSRLKHKHLPEIYSHFTDSHHWYLVMKYIEGKTLEDTLRDRSGKPLELTEALNIGKQLCEVLEYLHTYDPPIIFRDLKPGNIMLARNGDIYLIDFGTARRFAPGRKRDTGPLGTPGYAAPEQYGLAQTTAQTDIFGLGVTLQTLLTGKGPLELQAEGADVYTRYQIPPPLHPLLEQMQERNPDERPEDIKAVQKHFEAIEKVAHKYLPKKQQTQLWLWGFLSSVILYSTLFLIYYTTNFIQLFFIFFIIFSGSTIPSILSRILKLSPAQKYYIDRGSRWPMIVFILGSLLFMIIRFFID